MMRLCKNDFTDELRDLFNANPLRIPREGFQPLTLLEIDQGNKPHNFGPFYEVITGTYKKDIEIRSEVMAGFSMKKSKKINVGMGLELLGGYLGAFGIPPGTVKGEIMQHDKFSLSFSNVKRIYFNQTEFGRFLSLNQVLASEDFLMSKSPSSKLAIIVDTIVSNDFTISVFDKNDNSANLALPAIEASLANSNIEVGIASEASNEICFKKDYPMAFAFSCKEVTIEDGKFIAGEWIETSRGIGPDMSQTNLLDDQKDKGPLLIEFEE